jgi:hypothetical protein
VKTAQHVGFLLDGSGLPTQQVFFKRVSAQDFAGWGDNLHGMRLTHRAIGNLIDSSHSPSASDFKYLSDCDSLAMVCN